MRLSGKVAIVTGGSQGIVFATAKNFSENRVTVMITTKDSERLEKSTLEIPNSVGVVADIRNRNNVKNVVNKTVEKFGKLDILVNNAGISPKIKQLYEIDENEFT